MGIRTHRDTASFPLRDTQQFDYSMYTVDTLTAYVHAATAILPIFPNLYRTAQSRVEDVANAVAQQIEGEHGQSDREAGKQHKPPRRHQAGIQ